MNLFLTVLGVITAFLGIFFVQNLIQKVAVFLVTAFVIVLGHFSVENEFLGEFVRTGSLPSGIMSITGIGHWMQSVEFSVKLADEDKIIAEGLRLNEKHRKDERKIEGKKFGIELIAVNPDGFSIHLTNETGHYVQVAYIVRYSALTDWCRRMCSWFQGYD